MKRVLLSAAVAALTMLVAADAMAAGVAVVVNKSNPAEAMSMATLRQIVLSQDAPGTRSTLTPRLWPDGKKVLLVMPTGVPEFASTLKVVAGMSESDFNKHYMDAVFGGARIDVPKSVKTPAKVKEAVAASPGAVGFIPVSDVDDTVKVVKINGLTPGQPGYPLQ